MSGYRLGHALATAQPGGEELEAVALIGRRAGRTHRDSAVAAGLEEGGVRLPIGRIHPTDLTGVRVGVLDPTA
jgi:hypothetical protein